MKKRLVVVFLSIVFMILMVWVSSRAQDPSQSVTQEQVQMQQDLALAKQMLGEYVITVKKYDDYTASLRNQLNESSQEKDKILKSVGKIKTAVQLDSLKKVYNLQTAK